MKSPLSLIAEAAALEAEIDAHDTETSSELANPEQQGVQRAADRRNKMSEKIWCPLCGKWGDHGSASCPSVPSAEAPPEPAGTVGSLAQAAGSARQEFERWITAPPMEKDITRYSADESKSAWPGQYRSYEVQLAWEAWCAAIDEADTLARYEGKDGRRQWWSGGTWLYPGDRVALVSAPNTHAETGPRQDAAPKRPIA